MHATVASNREMYQGMRTLTHKCAGQWPYSQCFSGTEMKNATLLTSIYTSMHMLFVLAPSKGSASKQSISICKIVSAKRAESGNQTCRDPSLPELVGLTGWSESILKRLEAAQKRQELSMDALLADSHVSRAEMLADPFDSDQVWQRLQDCRAGKGLCRAELVQGKHVYACIVKWGGTGWHEVFAP